MYVFDTNVFITLGYYYPSRFPTIWKQLDKLVVEEKIISTREVYQELDTHAAKHVHEWIGKNKQVFLIPTDKECKVVRKMFNNNRFIGLIKKKNIIHGTPVADPFVIALAKIKGYAVVTQEAPARMPSVCQAFEIECMNLEAFLEKEDIGY